MTQDIKKKLGELKVGDIVKITIQSGDSFFAKFLPDNKPGKVTFCSSHGVLSYHSSGESWEKNSLPGSTIVGIRETEPEKVMRFLDDNEESFKEAEGK